MLLSKLGKIDVRMYKWPQLLNTKCWRLTITATWPLNAETGNHILQVRWVKLLVYCCWCLRLSLETLAFKVGLLSVTFTLSASIRATQIDFTFLKEEGEVWKPKWWRAGLQTLNKHDTTLFLPVKATTIQLERKADWRRKTTKNSTSLTLGADNSGKVCH